MVRPPAAARPCFRPPRLARWAVGSIRLCLLWCTGIGLRPEFWLRLRFRLGPGFRLTFRAGFGCRRFGCAFRNRLFSSYLDLFPPRSLGLFHDGFRFSVRNNVVSGTSVSVLVVLGGRRLIQTKNIHYETQSV